MTSALFFDVFLTPLPPPHRWFLNVMVERNNRRIWNGEANMVTAVVVKMMGLVMANGGECEEWLVVIVVAVVVILLCGWW